MPAQFTMMRIGAGYAAHLFRIGDVRAHQTDAFKRAVSARSMRNFLFFSHVLEPSRGLCGLGTCLSSDRPRA